MAIREIFNYIEAHKNEFPEAELVKKLKDQGYGDEEIREAYLMDAGTSVRKPVPESGEEKPPTLSEAVLRRFKKSEHPIVSVPAEEMRDFSAVKTRGEFLTGLFVPIAVFFFGVVIFLFLELFYPLQNAVQFGASGGSVLISLFMRGILKEASPNFKKGMRDGIVILFIWAMFSALSYMEMLPFLIE